MKLVPYHISVFVLLAGSSAPYTPAWGQSLPPIFERVPQKRASSRVVTALPKNTFLENIAIDRQGRAFITSHVDGVVYTLSAGGEIAPFARIDGKVTGIAIGPEGELVLTGADQHGAATLYLLDGRGRLKNTIPVAGGKFLNGLTRFQATTYLIADSYKGSIWLFDAPAGKVREWLAHPLLARNDETNPFPAINGIRTHANHVWVSNTAKQLLLRIPVLAGRPGTPEIWMDRVNIDDFAVGSEGEIYGATHVYNSVIRISRDKKMTTIATAEQGMVGSTSVALVRHDTKRPDLLVTTNGGMFLPPAGGVQEAKVVRLIQRSSKYQAWHGNSAKN